MAARGQVTQLMKSASQPQLSEIGQQDGEPYRPPFRQVLASLGLTAQSLQAETVTVPVSQLLRLVAEAFAAADVDEAWYIDRYPDVHAAILAGRTPSATAHFRAAGYREGRLPHPLPFDPDFYFATYTDLAAAFERTDYKGLQHHYETRGYLEGRAGVEQHFQAAGRWAGGLPRD